MKRIIALGVCLLFIVSLCGCGSMESIRENLADSGFEVEEMNESRISSLNNDVKYTYGGRGSVVSGFYANGENGESIICIEFSDKDDLTVMYKQIKSQLEDGWIIDIKGNIVVYGTQKAVKTALK
ncbi:MAG: hypothetical protein U0M42_02365 [Acutalibacteraceae bacterium]|nr:hypothetical protein [Acutalibacteraceae bacterium]